MKNQKIVNLRALAILIVMFGHSIIIYSTNWNYYSSTVTCVILDRLKKIIDCIQMPLYFSISGFLFYYSQKNIVAHTTVCHGHVSFLGGNKYFTFVISKFKRLIVPFIVFSLCWMLPIKLAVKYPPYNNNSIINIIFKKILWGEDNGYLWYLETLFFIFILMYPVCKGLYNNKNCSKWYCIVFISLLVIMFSSRYLKEIPILYNVSNYCFWFYLGFLINRLNNFSECAYIKFLPIICLVMIIIMLYTENVNRLIQFIIGLTFVFWIYNVIPDNHNIVIDMIAENSFGLYLFHSALVFITFAYIPNMSPFAVIIINFILLGVVSYLLTISIKKSKLKIIIGEYL